METSSVEIMDLPNEVLLQVFSNLTIKNTLTVIVSVCKRWRSIVEQDILFWKNLEVIIDCDRFFNSSYLDTQLASVDLLDQENKNQIFIGELDLKKVYKVKCLKFVNGNKSSNCPALMLIRIIDTVSKTCKEIEKVECSNCFGAASNHFLNFLNKCYCRITVIKFGISCNWGIPYNELTAYKNLTTIISHDYRFKRSDLLCLANSTLQLSCLWILYTRALKSNDVVYFVQQKKETLKELGLGCSVSDDILTEVKECKNLQVLFLRDSRFISNIGINSLNSMSKLRYLSLHRATFQFQSLVTWIESANVISQLIVLDLTAYKFQDSLTSLAPLQGCKITFNNDVNKAVDYSEKPHVKKDVHWMYLKVREGKM